MNSWHYRVCIYLKHRWGYCSTWKTVTFFPSLRKSILKDPKSLIFEIDSVSRWILSIKQIFNSHVLTVLLKGKLTVSTWNLILNPPSFWELSLEAQILSFNFRGSRTKFQDTQRIFRGSWTVRFQGNDLILKHKTIGWTKQLTHSFIYANPLLNVCKHFFVLWIFYKTHAVGLSTLKLITAN